MSPEGSLHVMMRVPLPTAVQVKVVELRYSPVMFNGGSVILGGSPEEVIVRYSDEAYTHCVDLLIAPRVATAEVEVISGMSL